MIKNAFRYSFKVWITAAMLSPILWGFLCMYLYGMSDIGLSEIGGCVVFYFFFVIVELIVSSLTWLMLTVIVQFAVNAISDTRTQRLIIFFSGIVLTGLTFAAIEGFFFAEGVFSGGFKWDDEISYFMYCTAAVISWGIWFYDLKIIDKNLEELETNLTNF